MKLKKILTIIITGVLLVGCSKNKEKIVETTAEIIKKETNTNLEIKKEFETTNSENVYEIKTNKNVQENLVSDDVLPSFGKEYDFSFSYPSSILPEQVTYLDNVWNVLLIKTPNLSYSINDSSLYLETKFEYGSNNILLSSYNERFKNLVENSTKLFGNYRYADKFVDIEDLKNKNINLLWDLKDCYIIQSFKNIKISTESEINEKGYIQCFIYFVSKNNLHEASGEEAPIIAFIESKISNSDLNILYQDDNGSYVLNKKTQTKNSEAIISKYLN